MNWPAFLVAVYGLGASTVALWYGGASKKSRRHGGGSVNPTSLVRISAEVYLLWWLLVPGALVSRTLQRRRATKEVL